MNLGEMKKEVADNLGMLSASDDTTINDGKVTSAGIVRNINYMYREVLFGPLSNKFPEDFSIETYRQNTYTATGTASTSSTTLTATSSIFNNSMEGFEVYNNSTGERIKIATYVSTTQVTLESAPTTAWSAVTIYVLGNELTFQGNADDIKLIKWVGIKYASTDVNFTDATFVNKDHVRPIIGDAFSQVTPYYYRTSVSELDANNVARPTPAIGILPFPVTPAGQIKIEYIQRPPKLIVDTDTPIPSLEMAGIGQAIVEGVTAWGKRKQGLFDEANIYEAKLEQQKQTLIRTYNANKYKKNQIIEDPYYSAMRNGTI